MTLNKPSMHFTKVWAGASLSSQLKASLLEFIATGV